MPRQYDDRWYEPDTELELDLDEEAARSNDDLDVEYSQLEGTADGVDGTRVETTEDLGEGFDAAAIRLEEIEQLQVAREVLSEEGLLDPNPEDLAWPMADDEDEEEEEEEDDEEAPREVPVGFPEDLEPSTEELDEPDWEDDHYDGDPAY